MEDRPLQRQGSAKLKTKSSPKASPSSSRQRHTFSHSMRGVGHSVLGALSMRRRRSADDMKNSEFYDMSVDRRATAVMETPNMRLPAQTLSAIDARQRYGSLHEVEKLKENVRADPDSRAFVVDMEEILELVDKSRNNSVFHVKVDYSLLEKVADLVRMDEVRRQNRQQILDVVRRVKQLNKVELVEIRYEESFTFELSDHFQRSCAMFVRKRAAREKDTMLRNISYDGEPIDVDDFIYNALSFDGVLRLTCFADTIFMNNFSPLEQWAAFKIQYAFRRYRANKNSKNSRFMNILMPFHTVGMSLDLCIKREWATARQLVRKMVANVPSESMNNVTLDGEPVSLARLAKLLPFRGIMEFVYSTQTPSLLDKNNLIRENMALYMQSLGRRFLAVTRLQRVLELQKVQDNMSYALSHVLRRRRWEKMVNTQGYPFELDMLKDSNRTYIQQLWKRTRTEYGDRWLKLQLRGRPYHIVNAKSWKPPNGGILSFRWKSYLKKNLDFMFQDQCARDIQAWWKGLKIKWNSKKSRRRKNLTKAGRAEAKAMAAKKQGKNINAWTSGFQPCLMPADFDVKKEMKKEQKRVKKIMVSTKKETPNDVKMMSMARRTSTSELVRSIVEHRGSPGKVKMPLKDEQAVDVALEGVDQNQKLRATISEFKHYLDRYEQVMDGLKAHGVVKMKADDEDDEPKVNTGILADAFGMAALARKNREYGLGMDNEDAEEALLQGSRSDEEGDPLNNTKEAWMEDESREDETGEGTEMPEEEGQSERGAGSDGVHESGEKDEDGAEDPNVVLVEEGVLVEEDEDDNGEEFEDVVAKLHKSSARRPATARAQRASTGARCPRPPSAPPRETIKSIKFQDPIAAQSRQVNEAEVPTAQSRHSYGQMFSTDKGFYVESKVDVTEEFGTKDVMTTLARTTLIDEMKSLEKDLMESKYVKLELDHSRRLHNTGRMIGTRLYPAEKITPRSRRFTVQNSEAIMDNAVASDNGQTEENLKQGLMDLKERAELVKGAITNPGKGDSKTLYHRPLTENEIRDLEQGLNALTHHISSKQASPGAGAKAVAAAKRKRPGSGNKSNLPKIRPKSASGRMKPVFYKSERLGVKRLLHPVAAMSPLTEIVNVRTDVHASMVKRMRPKTPSQVRKEREMEVRAVEEEVEAGYQLDEFYLPDEERVERVAKREERARQRAKKEEVVLKDNTVKMKPGDLKKSVERLTKHRFNPTVPAKPLHVDINNDKSGERFKKGVEPGLRVAIMRHQHFDRTMAARILQREWREYKKRKIYCAAVDIQRVFRGGIIRLWNIRAKEIQSVDKIVAAFMSYRTRLWQSYYALMATKIQATARGHQARQLLAHQHKSATFLQVWVRSMLQKLRDQRKWEKKVNASSRINAFYRGSKQRTQMRREILATFRIQTWWRMLMARWLKMMVLESGNRLQQSLGNYLKHIREKKKRRHQTLMRAGWTAFQQRQIVFHRHLCARKIQSFWKMYLVRRHIYGTLTEAITVVQRLVRGWQGRMRVSKRKNALIIIQRALRRCVRRSSQAKEHKAAVIVQAAWLRFRTVRDNMYRNEAAIAIQDKFMAVRLTDAVLAKCAKVDNAKLYLPAVIRQRRQQKLRDCAVRIQRTWRLKQVSRDKERTEDMAVKVQSLYRGWKVRSQVSKLGMAVLRLEAIMRSRIDRARASLLRKTGQNLTKCAVGYKARKTAATQESSALLVQSAFRRLLARKIVGFRRSSIVKIQSFIRMYSLRRRHLATIRGFTLLQAQGRGVLVRSSVARREAAARIIQRSVCVHKRCMPMEDTRGNASRKIQNWWRYCRCRARVATILAATTRIQSFFRYCLDHANKIKSRQAAREIVQKHGFGMLARVRLRMQKKSALIIESAFIQYMNRNAVLAAGNRKSPADVKVWTAASVVKSATTITRAARRYILRKSFSTYRRRVCLCQAVARRYIVRGEYFRRKGAVRTIQRGARRLLGRIATLRYEWKIVTIQALARRNRELRRFTRTRSGFVLLQAIHRKRLAVKRLIKLGKRPSSTRLGNAEILSRAKFAYKTFRLEHDMWWRSIRRSVYGVQAISRGVLCRAKLRDLDFTATQITRVARGHLGRKVARHRLAAVLKLQFWFMGVRTRRQISAMNEAARKIQKMYFDFRSMRAYKSRVDEIIRAAQDSPFEPWEVVSERAASRLGCWARGCLLRKDVGRRERSSLKIQMAWRGYVVRRGIDDTKKAVKMVEAKYRGDLTRHKYPLDILSRGIKGLQAIARSYIARRRADKRVAAALVIQTWWRRLKAEWHTILMRWSAIVIPRNFRRSVLRLQKERQKNIEEGCNVRELRSILKYRRYAMGCRYMYRRVVRHIVLAQSFIRCVLGKRKARLRKHSILVLQSGTRGFISRMRLRHKHQSAARIQALVRGVQHRANEKAARVRGLGAIVEIERSSRGWLSRLRTDRENQAARTIQAGWWMFIDKRYFRYYSKLKHCLCIQRSYRAYVRRRLHRERAEFSVNIAMLCMSVKFGAATKIQQWYRRVQKRRNGWKNLRMVFTLAKSVLNRIVINVTYGENAVFDEDMDRTLLASVDHIPPKNLSPVPLRRPYLEELSSSTSTDDDESDDSLSTDGGDSNHPAVKPIVTGPVRPLSAHKATPKQDSPTRRKGPTLPDALENMAQARNVGVMSEIERNAELQTESNFSPTSNKSRMSPDRSMTLNTPYMIHRSQSPPITQRSPPVNAPRRHTGNLLVNGNVEALLDEVAGVVSSPKSRRMANGPVHVSPSGQWVVETKSKMRYTSPERSHHSVHMKPQHEEDLQLTPSSDRDRNSRLFYRVHSPKVIEGGARRTPPVARPPPSGLPGSVDSVTPLESGSFVTSPIAGGVSFQLRPDEATGIDSDERAWGANVPQRAGKRGRRERLFSGLPSGKAVQ